MAKVVHVDVCPLAHTCGQHERGTTLDARVVQARPTLEEVADKRHVLMEDCIPQWRARTCVLHACRKNQVRHFRET